MPTKCICGCFAFRKMSRSYFPKQQVHIMETVYFPWGTSSVLKYL